MIKTALIPQVPALIDFYHEKGKLECIAQSLTRNQIKKLIWAYIKSSDFYLSLDEIFEKKLIEHQKHIESRLRNTTFVEIEIGYVLIKEDKIIFISDEHSELIIYNPKAAIKNWQQKTLEKYERERCVAIIDNKIFTRLDVTK